VSHRVDLGADDPDRRDACPTERGSRRPRRLGGETVLATRAPGR